MSESVSTDIEPERELNEDEEEKSVLMSHPR